MGNDRTAAERMQRYRKNRRHGIRIARVPVSWDLLDAMQANGYLRTSGIPDWTSLNMEEVESALESMLSELADGK